jgi:phage terminase large subunit GpA-like protein
MADAAAAYRAAFLEGLRPEELGTVDQWADRYRILGGIGCPEPGPWRTDRTPHLREPMQCLSAGSRVRRVVLMFGSQTGKTEVGLNWLGSIIHWRPAPTLLVQPTLEMAKRLNRQRLEPFIRETPVLSERIAPPRSRDSGNTAFLKLFPGGLFVLAGANSASAAQSMPAANLFADEVSSYPLELDDKGDPLENFESRTATFRNGKTLVTSTPGEEGSCRVTWEYNNRSDQRQRHVPCPACGSMQILVWPQFKWDSADGEVFYECVHCGERFEERHKTRFLADGEWIASAKGDGITAGFHLPSWYTPLGLGYSWEEIRDQFLRAKDDRILLKGWINKRAAKAWKDDIENQFTIEGLAKRRQDLEAGNGYPVDTVPAGVLLLTAGVDVQGGGGSVGERIVVTIWGWGRGEEGWHIGHWEIHGDPQQPEVWQQLDNVAATRWRREDGREIVLARGGIDDGGHAPAAVRTFCQSRLRVWAPMKGSGADSKGLIGKGSPVDVDAKNRSVSKPSRGLLLYSVGTDASIVHLQGRLRNDSPGPGYLHLGEAASDQFLSELFPWKRRARMVKGFTKYEWHLPTGCHDEAGDCTRMAYAALQLVARRYNRATMWDQIEASLGQAKPERRQRQREAAPSMGGGGFVGSW